MITDAPPRVAAPEVDLPDGDRRRALPRFGHQPALDGVRGLAVGLVLLFHAGITWMAGGFLGIDLFFVLSGFLITTLLLGEAGRDGRINLRRFWERRARRLLPVVLLVLVAVAVAAWLITPAGELERIRRDGIATLLYVSNWMQVGDRVGYFDRFSAPSPLLHTWSLAVEEQYYLVWPVVVAVLARLTFRRGRGARRWRQLRRRLLVVALGGAAASIAAMVILSVRGADPNRLYLGTDTRGHALLIGAALAMLAWGRWRREGDPAPPQHRAPTHVTLDLCGLAAAALIVVASVRKLPDAWLYRGGFTGVALAAAVLVAATTRPGRTWCGALFSLRPLAALGRISYGAYLWHWPIYQWLTPRRTGWDLWPLTAARIGTTLVVAAVSYRLFEAPLRHRVRWSLWLAPAASIVVAVALVAATTGAVASDADRFAADERRNAAPPSVPTTPPPPQPPAVTKVLVIGDSLASSLVRGWTPGPELAVTDRTLAACGRGVEAMPGQPPPCGDWTTQLPAAVEEVRPDVTLLVARSWHPLSRNPELAVDYTLDIAKPTNLLLDDLQGVLQAVTARGGSLVIGTVPETAVDGAEQGTAKMFGGVARALATAEPDRVAVVDLAPGCPAPCGRDAAGLAAAAAGAELSGLAAPTVRQRVGAAVRERHLALWRAGQANRGGTPSATKVLMVGDSVGWSLGSYWYGQSGQPAPGDPIRLWNRATFFCELDGGPRLERSGKVELSKKCANWREDWARYVREFAPDVVALMVGSWEVFDRRIDGTRMVFGDPPYDTYLSGLLTEAVAILSSGGAKVVILTQPPPVMKPDPGAPREWWDRPGPRFDHVNGLLRAVAAAQPDRTVLIDLAAYVCGGTPCGTEVGGVRMRPDGVHYGADGGLATARWLGPQLRQIHLDSLGTPR